MTRQSISSQRSNFSGQTKNLIPALVAAGFLLFFSGCTEKRKDAPQKKQQTFDANSASTVGTGGFELQDSKPLSGSIVRLIEGNDLAAPTISSALIVSSNVAIAVGFSCRTADLHLVFQSQGDDTVESRSSIKGETRKVTNCEGARSILEKKMSEGTSGSSNAPTAAPENTAGPASETLTELKRILERYPKFELAKLSFEGGLPATSAPKWTELAAFNASLKLDSKSDSFSAWQALSGKFVVIAGFAKDTNTAQGPLSKRVWLPFRVGDKIEGESALIFSLQAWFSEGDRSPFKKFSDWLAGPENLLHPAIAFAGVTRYPNIRPFTEIQTVSSSALCFVIQWDENKETAENLRFAARCVDAAPFIALLN